MVGGDLVGAAGQVRWASESVARSLGWGNLDDDDRRTITVVHPDDGAAYIASGAQRAAFVHVAPGVTALLVDLERMAAVLDRHDAVSAAVSSVMLPIPIIIAACG